MRIFSVFAVDGNVGKGGQKNRCSLILEIVSVLEDKFKTITITIVISSI